MDREFLESKEQEIYFVALPPMSNLKTSIMLILLRVLNFFLPFRFYGIRYESYAHL